MAGAGGAGQTVSVAILTVPDREEDLRRCLDAVGALGEGPDEVVVIEGETSYASALRAAWERTRGDWIALLDDDAIPQSDWLGALRRHLDDPGLGAVGGRVLEFIEGRSRARRYERGPATALSWFGRPRTRLRDIPVRPLVEEAEFLQGSNLCVRREAMPEIDPGLDVGMAPGFEMALCQDLRGRGWAVRFDSEALVTHYPAPRPAAYARGDRRRHAYEYSQVTTYTYARNPNRLGRLAALAYFWLIGQRPSPGLLLLPAFLLPGRDRGRAAAAIRGKLAGQRAARARGPIEGPVPPARG